MPSNEPIPVHTKNLIDWLRERQESLERRTPAEKLNATRIIYERGFNDAVEAILTFIDTRYANTYKDD